MGVNLQQTDLGHLNLKSDIDDRVVLKVGGKWSAPTGSDPAIATAGRYKFPLVAADTAGGMVSYANPYSYDLMIHFAVLDVTTASSGACTVSVGYTVTSGTTLSSTLINGQTTASAGTFNSGAKSIVWPSGKWVTASVASGASAGIVGYLYVDVVPR